MLWVCLLEPYAANSRGNSVVVESDIDPTGNLQMDPGYVMLVKVASARPFNPNIDSNYYGTQKLGVKPEPVIQEEVDYKGSESVKEEEPSIQEDPQ